MTLRHAFPLVLLLFTSALTQVPAQAPDRPASPAENADAPSLAPTPPMGWASWNHFFCDYDEKTIREQADALVSTGMRDAGYRYVVIQECIARQRDASGKLIEDAVRFPSGMPALTAYIHARGLKAGVYTDIGKHTCFPNPQYQGSYGHEQQDADTFAQWGMDFVEMDFCNREPEHSGRWVYERMAQAIRHTGRPMIFYLCAWGNEQPWEWAQGKAQMWRTEFDISLEKNHVEWARLVRNFESNTVHSVLSGPESWNDADMLEIGNPGLSDLEAQAQMSMWAISPSPLLAGADLLHMSPRSRQIYLNKEVIAINQDPLGAGADKISNPAPGLEIWSKPLGARTSGDLAVLLLNASGAAAAMQLNWDQLGLQSAVARDLWRHVQVESTATGYQGRLAPHSALLLRVHGQRSWRQGVALEAEWPGVERLGNASLFPCGECSSGYAMALGGTESRGTGSRDAGCRDAGCRDAGAGGAGSDDAGSGGAGARGGAGSGGAVRFNRLVVPAAGAYTARLTYTRNGLEDKQIDVTVNGSRQKVLAIMRSWNWVDVPVTLHAGSNDLTVGYDGRQSFYLDKVTLIKGSIEP